MARESFAEWMPFHGDDFFEDADVIALSPAAQALYLKLLWRQWRFGEIPREESVLGRISQFHPKVFRSAWGQIKNLFPPDSEGRLRNPRCAELRENAERNAEKWKDNAARMNAKRGRGLSQGSSRAPTQGSSRGMSLDGDGEGDIQQPQPTGACARESPPPTAPQQPQPRLLELLAEWDERKTAAMAKAPKPTPELCRAFAAVDRPDLDWSAVLAAVCACDALNGLGAIRKPHATPYVMPFRKMLDPKTIENALTGVYATPEIHGMGLPPSIAATLAKCDALDRQKNTPTLRKIQ